LAPTIADVLATARRDIAMLASVRIEAVKLDLKTLKGIRSTVGAWID
jgi:hypothetical protein